MILNGEKISDTVVKCNGILFIGDPHVSSKKPGRRVDDDWPNSILKKLEFLANYSRENKLVPIFLGDLLDEPVEKDEGLKTKMTRILKKFYCRPFANTGNHEMENAELSDQDTLAFLGTSDVLNVIAKSGPVLEFSLGSKRIGLGMTPYGQEIPQSVEGLFPEADAVIWATHHDIAFEKSYPNALQPYEIKGCGLVVNGHMHDTKPVKVCGKTAWYNPGNINRKSVDLIEHVPCGWVFTTNGRMEPIEIPHQKSVFDLTGRFVEAIEDQKNVRDVNTAFVTLLQAESTTEMKISADGSLMLEDIKRKFERDNTPENVQVIVTDLLREAVKRRTSI